MRWVNAFVQPPEKSEDVKKYFIKYNGKMYVAEWKYNTFYVSWGGIPHSDDQFGPSYEDRRDQLSNCYWLDETDESPSSDPAEVLVKGLTQIVDEFEHEEFGVIAGKCAVCIAKFTLEQYEQLKQHP